MRPTALAALAFSLVSACTVHEAHDLVRPTVDDDPSLPALDVNGTRLHVEQRGAADAPVVILFHGGPGGDFAYLEALDEPVDGWRLSDAHHIVLWDQRGTGLSRRHGAPALRLVDYQRDLEALVDTVAPPGQGARDVYFVGHSWGAAYAAWYLGAHPERVAGAVLLDMQALTRALYDANPLPIDVDVFAEWLDDPLWSRGVMSPGDHARADFWLASLQATPLPRFHNHAYVPNFRPGAAVFRYLNRDWHDDYDFATPLSRYTREVLLLGGTDDEILGYAFQQRQVVFFPHASLAPVPGAGHNDVVRDPNGDSRRLIRDYLRRVEGR